jgi:glycosyltransferase involved in cell wall biosynthesis
MSVSTPVIAMVTDAIAPYHRGGKEQRYDELAPRLTRFADVHVYTMKWWRGRRRTTRRDGVTYHAICPFLPLYRGERRSIAQALMFALSSLRLLFARFDVLEADHMPYLQLFPLKLVTALRGKRLVVTWHEVWDRAQWKQYLGAAGNVAWALEQFAMRLPDCIIAASPHTGERLEERIGGRVPIVVAPNGIDLELVSRTPAALEPADVVSVGRLLSHKRFDLLLEAIAVLADEGREFTCRIIGGGPERPALRMQAVRLGIGHLVDFRHEVRSSEELLSLVKASRVFVFPSEREGFGIAALEAIACGLPVITTTAPHNLAQHLVERSARGVLCAPTAQSLADAIERAVSANELERPELDRDWLGEYDWATITERIAHTLAAADDRPAELSLAAADDPPAELSLAAGDDGPAQLRRAAADDRPAEIERGSRAALLSAASTDAATVTLTGSGGRPPPPPEHEGGWGGPPDDDEEDDYDGEEDDHFPVAVELAERELITEEAFNRLTAHDPARPSTRARLLDLLVSLLAIGAMAGLSNVRGAWIVQALELVLLLSVPGVLLLRALTAEAEAVKRFPLYVLCGSIAVMMVSGLLVDLIGPGVGISRPLATVPLEVSLAAVCVLLTFVAVIRKAPMVRDYMPGSIPLARAWPLLLPLIAWVGATRLTNGDGDTVAIVAVAVTGAALLVAVWASARWSVSQTAVLIYGASLALMWGFSLRGHFVYGFDISSEYQTFTQILHAGRWHAAHHNDAYGAMLSLTVFPSMLTKLTGASPVLVLRAIYPLMFALFPVAVYLLATRALRLRFAYLAVLFIVVQNYLFQQLPAIARQEIALLFFVCLVAALLDSRLRTSSQIGLVFVLALGLVLSHYGTAYLTVALLAGALILELARWLITPRRRHVRVLSAIGAARRLPLTAIAAGLVFTAGTAAVWYEPVTDSAQNLSQFVSDLNKQGLSILPNAGRHGILQSYLAGNVATRENAARYAAGIRREYVKNRRYVRPLPQAFLPSNRAQNATVPGQRVRSHLVLNGLSAEQVILSQLAILLAAIGAFWLWWRRGAVEAARLLGLLGVSTLGLLVVIRLSGTAANDYNQNRAFLQAMVPLSVCLGWMLQRCATMPRVGRAVAPAFAVAFGLLFLTTTGLRATMIGGGRLTNLATSGEDYERYYVTQPELAAARWLNGAAPQGQIVSTDRYGLLRLAGATGRTKAVLPNVTPSSLDEFAWIYADNANFVAGRARGQDGSRYAIYMWPAFISQNFNLVYSNGSAGVYTRSH